MRGSEGPTSAPSFHSRLPRNLERKDIIRRPSSPFSHQRAPLDTRSYIREDISARKYDAPDVSLLYPRFI